MIPDSKSRFTVRYRILLVILQAYTLEVNSKLDLIDLFRTTSTGI